MIPSNNGLVDIDLGNACSKNAYNWSKRTFSNRLGRAGSPHQGLDGGFANLLQFGNARIGIASDGIGTKIELAERTKIYNTLGFDLIAMVADDLAANGFEPTNISNIIDADRLDYHVIDQLMNGLHDAANFSNIAISGGEIAELGNRIGGYGDGMHFNWCSTAIGVLPEALEQPIDGSQIAVGDVVITLQSRGFRSNGFSLIRRIMQEKFGDLWQNEKYDEQQTWGEVLLTPSLIYAPLISQLIEQGLIPKGIAHITGGGIKDNLERVVRNSNIGAKLDHLFEPLPVMHRIMELGKVSDERAYLYWNMGNGMLLTVSPNQVDQTMQMITQLGYTAQVAGKTVATAEISI